MKKIIAFFLCVLLSCPVSALSFGRTSSGTLAEKAWLPTYWSTLSNIQQTNYDSSNGANGYLVLGFQTATSSEAWNTIPAGWVEAGGGGTGADTKIEPAGWLHQWSSTINTTSNIYNNKWAGSGVVATNTTIGRIISCEGLSTSAETTSIAGNFITHDNGTRAGQYGVRSDGTYLDVYSSNGLGTWTKTDTTIPVDKRVHIQMIYNANANNSSIMVCDGEEIATGLKTFATFLTGYVELSTVRRSADPAIVGDYTTSMYYWNTVTPWTMALATVESDETKPEFDAGAGKQWATVLWDANIANSTAITMEVRCTNEVTGMSFATWEAIAYPTEAINAKGRYIDVRFQMTAASSGRYTPTMKYLELSSETTPVGGYIYSKKNKGHSKK